MPIAAVRALGLDEDVVNVLGSGCSLGHPVAMTGTRMVLTLIHEMRRRGGGTARGGDVCRRRHGVRARPGRSEPALRNPGMARRAGPGATR